MKEPSIEEQLVREWVGSVTVTEEMHNAGVIWLEAVVGEVTKGLQSERRKAAIEELKLIVSRADKESDRSYVDEWLITVGNLTKDRIKELENDGGTDNEV